MGWKFSTAQSYVPLNIMNEQEQKNLQIYTSVAESIKRGMLSYTDANKYLDSIDFDAEWRYPGLHMADDGTFEHYRWHEGQWERIN